MEGEDGNYFYDETCGVPFTDQLYLFDGHVYIDEKLTIPVEVTEVIFTSKEPEHLNKRDPFEFDVVEMDPAVSPLSITKRKFEQITYEQTNYLIDKMKVFLTEEEELPNNLQQLQLRIKRSKDNKRNVFFEITEDINMTFETSFGLERITRKWGTLVDTYKKIKDNATQTGESGPDYYGKFRHYKEMDDLIGTHHDITPLVLGTADVKYRTETQVKQKRITSPKSKTPKCSPIDSLLSYFQERDKVDDAQREK